MAAEESSDSLYWVVCYNCMAAISDTPKEGELHSFTGIGVADPGSGAFLPTGSGSWKNFFRIRD
jgi:hypothetical protein